MTGAPREIVTFDHDGSAGYSYLPEDHCGPCAMCFDGHRGEDWVIFPSVEEGEEAVGLALTPQIGGYRNAALHPVSDAPPTARRCETAGEWLLEDDPRPSANPLLDPHYRNVYVRTVGELRAALSGLPDEMPIVHSGYAVNGFSWNRKGALARTAEWHFSDIEAGVRQERRGLTAFRLVELGPYDWRQIAGREPEQGE